MKLTDFTQSLNEAKRKLAGRWNVYLRRDDEAVEEENDCTESKVLQLVRKGMKEGLDVTIKPYDSEGME